MAEKKTSPKFVPPKSGGSYKAASDGVNHQRVAHTANHPTGNFARPAEEKIEKAAALTPTPAAPAPTSATSAASAASASPAAKN